MVVAERTGEETMSAGHERGGLPEERGVRPVGRTQPRGSAPAPEHVGTAGDGFRLA